MSSGPKGTMRKLALTTSDRKRAKRGDYTPIYRKEARKIIPPRFHFILYHGVALILALFVTAGVLRMIVEAHPSAQPATTVANTNDSGAGSLRQAIADANPGDTIDFNLPSGSTITLNGNELSIDKNLTIKGPGADQLAVSGNGASRVFYIGSASASVDVAISGLTIKDGSSYYGGGIFNYDGSTVNLSNNTVSGNTADHGGGILNGRYSKASLANSTVSGNMDFYRGGGILNLFGTVSLTNSTVSGNVANYGGGGIYNSGGNAKLGNTIVADNTAGDAYGTFSSQGHNLIGNSSGSSGFGASDLLDQDPMLVPPQNNDGPTRTHALQPGSPAIDAGDDALVAGLAYDQRGDGHPRIQGKAVDIGAFESGEAIESR